MKPAEFSQIVAYIDRRIKEYLLRYQLGRGEGPSRVGGTTLSLGGTVVSETTYGQSAGAGASLYASAADHTHGTVGHDAHTYLTGVTADQHHAQLHASSHMYGGSDAVKLDDLAVPDDNTDLDATTGRHGLLPKLGGGSTNFFRADGTWAAPAGGPGGSITVEESDGTPSVATVTKIKVTNGTLTDEGGGVVSLVTATGETFTYYDPDKPPATAHAKDDEFDNASLDAKWTQFQNTGLTLTEANHLLGITGATHAGDRVQGIFQAVPAGDWTIVTRVSLHAPVADFALAGIALFEDATNNPNTCDIYTFWLAYKTASAYRFVEAVRWNQFDSWNSSLVARDLHFGFGHQYLKIVKSGTTYAFWLSSDGIGWGRAYSGTLAFAPAEFGLVVNNSNTGVDVSAYFDFFRVSAADPGKLGGLRTVGAVEGAQLTLGDSVVSEETYGLSDSAGASLYASRADHTHGTPGHDDPAYHPLGTVVPHDQLDSLTNVQLSGVSDGDVLTYRASSGKWINYAGGGGTGGSLTVEESDGSPSVANVNKLKVSNGTLTDNGDGSVTLTNLTGGSIFDDILEYLGANNSNPIDVKITRGNLVALVYLSDSNSTSWKSATNAVHTVTAGKTAVIVAGGGNGVSDTSYRKCRLHNTTDDSTVWDLTFSVLDFAFGFPWSGELGATTKLTEVAAGKTIKLQVRTADTNRRQMGGWVILREKAA